MSRCILIVDERWDMHARIVAVGLRQMGHDALRWHIDELAASDVSVVVDPGAPPRVFLPGLVRPINPCVVWWKRGHFPKLPASLSPIDVELARREWPLFLVGIEQILGRAWHVNTQEARRRTNAKAFQLAMAARCGLRIPRTVFTNDAARARRFIAANRNAGGTVVKLVAPHFLRDTTGAAYESQTSQVFVEQVPGPAETRAVPVMLQQRVPKAYELRVTVFGRTVFAARIDAPCLQDYHAASDLQRLKVRPAALPATLTQRCFKLMDTLGIVAGSFDFIVTDAGDHVFLEVNEQGQFLWLERLCPDLLLLDAFCAFLVAADKRFCWKPTARPLRLRDVEASREARAALDEDRQAAALLHR